MLCRRLLALCLGSLILCASATAEDWPQFRGPTGEGISTAKDVPTQWSATSNIAWKVELAGQGWSSPVLSKGRLYVTYALNSTSGTTLVVTCFNAADGKTLWNREVLKPDSAAVRQMHSKNSPASPTPIVTDDRIFAHFGHLGTVALDLDGNIIWKQTSLPYAPMHGNGGSPALVDGLLIFGCDGLRDPFIVALDAKTGDVKWKHARTKVPVRNTFSFATPLLIALSDRKELIDQASGFVAGYDPKNGDEIWRVRYGDGYSVVPRPVFADGLVFISSGFDTPVMYAINPDGATGDVTENHVAWKTRRAAPCTPSPLAVGHELYFISDAGILNCVDTKTGKSYYTHRLDGGFSASPILAEGRIYFQSEEGIGYVIKAGTTFEQVSENDLGERSLASYTVTDGAIFIRTAKHLWRVGAAAK
jgi:outer membrane protein assembly factor BamB